MSTLDELWEWIRHPLEELEKNFTEEPDKSWESRRGEFLERLGVQEPSQHPVTEQMFKQLDEMSDDERKNQLSSKQFETVAYGFAQQHAASQDAASPSATQAAAGGGPGYDEQAWHNYLTTNATQWNGTEETWNQFTQWFLYYAQENSVTAPATALIDYLNPLPADQRITELARYGVTITPPQTQAAAAGGGPGYDEQAWHNYLTTNATQWNGTEETWNQFTQWFLYYAQENSVTAPATALIDYLNPLPADQRIIELARYGVTITPPQTPAAPQASQPGQQEASPEAEQHVAGIMDELLATNPEFAAIPEERRIEIMNEALSRVHGAGN